jgi:hypothetical protein
VLPFLATQFVSMSAILFGDNPFSLSHIVTAPHLISLRPVRGLTRHPNLPRLNNLATVVCTNFEIIVSQYKVSNRNPSCRLTFQNQMSRFFRPIHQWNLGHILSLKYSPSLHEILDSPYLPLVLFLDRIFLCCRVGALLVGLNQFNTGRFTELTRRAIL